MTPLVELDPPHTPPVGADAGFERPFMVRHNLIGHPLLTADAIARLVARLPETSAEHNFSDVPVILPSGQAPRAEAHHADVAREIARGAPAVNGSAAQSSWLVLTRIEQDPEYAALLDEVLDCIDRQMGRDLTKIRRVGFIFLSAPGSTTPVHIDPEHNFLLQIEGTKTINVGRFSSSDVRERDLERCYSSGQRNLDWLPAEADEVVMAPGTGVFVPNMAPHWVTSGPDVSVSLSVSWRSIVVNELASVTRFNHRLRRYGFSPRPYGASKAADRAKLAVLRVGEGTRPLRHAISAAVPWSNRRT